MYGEEATRKAKEEGEQAVAIFEQEQKDIAEGKIPTTAPTDTMKKKVKRKSNSAPSKRGRESQEKGKDVAYGGVSNLHSCLDDTKAMYPKMSRVFQGFKSTVQKDDDVLITDVTSRIHAARQRVIIPSPYHCIPIRKSTKTLPSGCAMLIGLCPDDFGWRIETFLQSTQNLVAGYEEDLKMALDSEFGKHGINTRFRTIIKGFPCIIGKASKHLEEAASALGFYGTGLGCTIGNVDCNIGGLNSCSEIGAVLFYSKQQQSFQLAACGSNDSISVDGKSIKPSEGSITIGHKSICSVGSRVFMFMLASS